MLLMNRKLVSVSRLAARPTPVVCVLAVALTLCVLFGFGGLEISPGEPPREDAAPTTNSTPPRVNVVLFVIDTLRADRLGVYGYQRRPTSPNIDALARSGIVFEQACAPAPWTLPSMVSILTSTYLCEHQILDNRQKLGDELEPLAARLKRLGYAARGLYANALVGPTYGLARGFDSYMPLKGKCEEKIRQLLDNVPPEPLFLYVHTIEPHTPYLYAPMHLDGFRDVSRATRKEIQESYLKYRNSTRVDFAAKEPLGTTDNSAEQKHCMAALNARRDDYNELYDAAIVAADQLVEVLIERLKERGLWDNTLFILTSDHGEEMNEHGGWLHDQSVYQELVHVPLVMHLPHDQYAGRRISRVISLVDVLPTIFDVLDQPSAARGARGASLMPLIRGTADVAENDLCVTSMRWNAKKYYRPWKESRGDVNLVLRLGEWKGIWNVEPQTLELYNLRTDPAEQRDVCEENPELSLKMKQHAATWLEECRTWGSASSKPAPEPDEETLENLRRLGYAD